MRSAVPRDGGQRRPARATTEAARRGLGSSGRLFSKAVPCLSANPEVPVSHRVTSGQRRPAQVIADHASFPQRGAAEGRRSSHRVLRERISRGALVRPAEGRMFAMVNHSDDDAADGTHAVHALKPANSESPLTYARLKQQSRARGCWDDEGEASLGGAMAGRIHRTGTAADRRRRNDAEGLPSAGCKRWSACRGRPDAANRARSGHGRTRSAVGREHVVRRGGTLERVPPRAHHWFSVPTAADVRSGRAAPSSGARPREVSGGSRAGRAGRR
jgi:hypothetical protein